MKIVIISDTHIPKAAADLPARVYEEIRSSDMVIHAGDITEMGLIEKLQGMCKTVAVCGNMDSPKVRSTLKAKETVELGALRLGLIHGYGAPSHLMQTVSQELPGMDIVVFGHSHRAEVARKGRTLFINPGSPTDTVFAPFLSFAILVVDGQNADAEIVKLGD